MRAGDEWCGSPMPALRICLLCGWDNLEKAYWDSMGRRARVGHDKLLISLARVAPSTGTTKKLPNPMCHCG
jgi:hypothetical protein